MNYHILHNSRTSAPFKAKSSDYCKDLQKLKLKKLWCQSDLISRRSYHAINHANCDISCQTLVPDLDTIKKMIKHYHRYFRPLHGHFLGLGKTLERSTSCRAINNTDFERFLFY